MTIKSLTLTAVISIFPLAAFATVINVPADYPAIQQGIDASADGDTVLVQPGTYVENINFNGHNIVLGSLFLTTGDTSYIEQTVIDGDSAGTVVRFENGEDSMAIITGFSIKNGSALRGGGISCLGAQPHIISNIIEGNISNIRGGGISCSDSSNPLIFRNIIRSNISYSENPVSGYGGGISCEGHSTPLIFYNFIISNTASGGGGGICCNVSNPIIVDNEIYENHANTFGGGGGIAVAFSDVIITNNSIHNNTGMYEGGGISIGLSVSGLISNNEIIRNHSIDIDGGGGISCGSSEILISNNLIIENEAYKGGGIKLINCEPNIFSNTFYNNSCNYQDGKSIYCINSNPIIINSILRSLVSQEHDEIFLENNSSPQIAFCNVRGGWPGTGNIDVDPLFRDPDSGDFHLMSIACGDSIDSPCIDAGDPNILDSLLDCSWGLGGLRSDMGAYGGGDSATVGVWDLPFSLPKSFMLLQNYPNPFNAQTTIGFILPKSVSVQLAIYDLLGRQIDVLADEFMQSGTHKITFDASSLSSGVYFYRLRAGDVVETKRMVLLK